MGISPLRGLLIPENHLPMAFQTLNWIQAPEVICIIREMFTKMLTSGRTGRAGTCGQSQLIPGHSPDVKRETRPTCGQEDSSAFEAVCSRPTETGSVKH